MLRRLSDRQPVLGGDELLGGQRLAVDLQARQHELLAVEDERGRGAGRGVRLERERRPHPRRRGIEPDVEVDRLDQPVGRAIVGKADGTAFLGAHFRSTLWEWEGRFYSYT